MAKFELQLPEDLIKDFEKINNNAEKIFGEMTRAGAEVVKSNVENNIPSSLLPYVKLSKIYKTPTDRGINTQVYVSGYIPFSNPNRKYFIRGNGSGNTYKTSQGIPAEFLANLYEYGRSTSPFPKKPFLRKSFKKAAIERAMRDAQKRLSGGLLDE